MDSDQLAISNAVSYIVDKLDHRDRVAGLYFDLSRAFDTMDHQLLLHRLEQYGIRGICQQLIKSYLSKRTQIVCVAIDGDTHFSPEMTVGRGVPQGSILGPLLSLMYVNGLGDCFDGAMVCQYADDTSVILADPSLERLSGACSCAARAMQEWCVENCLTLIASKTGLIWFSKTSQNESL